MSPAPTITVASTAIRSSYSQLSVGVELDVTPFINPDGLVVMDINQEIDDMIPNSGQGIGGGVTVPETDKRTLSSEIAVRNGDTVMLGGFIKNQKQNNRSGVPFLAGHSADRQPVQQPQQFKDRARNSSS